jgi:two-component system cell cycle response regulator
VTVSIGVATGAGSDPEELLRNADAALYAAKAAGRNVVAAGSGAGKMRW